MLLDATQKQKGNGCTQSRHQMHEMKCVRPHTAEQVLRMPARLCAGGGGRWVDGGGVGGGPGGAWCGHFQAQAV